jgi:hypothetical protein
MFKGKKKQRRRSDHMMLLGVMDRSSSAKSIIWKIKTQKNAHRSCRETCRTKSKKMKVEKFPNALEPKNAGD